MVEHTSMEPKIIKIAYLIDTISSDTAGTEKQILNIIKRLDKKKIEIILICLWQSKWMNMNPLPCEIVTLGYKGFLKPSFLRVLFRYLRLLKEKRFDAVQTFFEDSMFVGYFGKKLSRTNHVLIVSRRDMGLGIDVPGYHGFYKKIKPFVLRSADGILTNALAIKNWINKDEKVPNEKIQVIPNGLDLPAASSNVPRLFTENNADVWIGIVANLKPVKRIDMFLRAFARINELENEKVVRAVILGEGRLKPDLLKLAHDLGIAERVHFMGALKSINDYLYNFDIGVLCSEKEGLSNAILEYMSFGLPVVATAVGGNGERSEERRVGKEC
jgi:glycosyltransferase involved in cell wall biosynthesis